MNVRRTAPTMTARPARCGSKPVVDRIHLVEKMDTRATRDHMQREAIWRSAFPARTPLGAVDHGKLARLGVTGGSIRNIAINAAFCAAEFEAPVSMAHLLHAAHHEASNRERPLSDAEVRGWV